MALLRTSLLVFTTACYSPSTPDCVVACTQPADCAPGQLCGDDGFCAREDVAGTCHAIASVDAAPVDDARPPPRDAMPDAAPDATTTVRVWVRIDGRGVVSIAGMGACDAGSGQADCPFDVAAGVPVTLHASPKNNWRFDEWRDACDGQPTPTCVIAPTMPVQVHARFRMFDEDD